MDIKRKSEMGVEIETDRWIDKERVVWEQVQRQRQIDRQRKSCVNVEKEIDGQTKKEL